MVFVDPMDAGDCWWDGFISSFNVADDETGFNLKLRSNGERDAGTFWKFDCIGIVAGIGVDVVSAVLAVVVDEVETTAISVGNWIWSILVKSFFPRLAYGSRRDAARNCCWIVGTVCWLVCSCDGGWDIIADEDDVTAGWVCVTGKPWKNWGWKVDAIVVVVVFGVLFPRILVAVDAKGNDAVVGTTSFVPKIEVIGAAFPIVTAGILKIFVALDVGTVGFKAGNAGVLFVADVVVEIGIPKIFAVVIGTILLEDVAVFGCENIFVFAAGWDTNINGADVLVFVLKPKTVKKYEILFLYFYIKYLLNGDWVVTGWATNGFVVVTGGVALVPSVHGVFVTDAVGIGWLNMLPDVLNMVEGGVPNGFAVVVVVVLWAPKIFDVVAAVGNVPKHIRKTFMLIDCFIQRKLEILTSVYTRW